MRSVQKEDAVHLKSKESGIKNLQCAFARPELVAVEAENGNLHSLDAVRIGDGVAGSFFHHANEIRTSEIYLVVDPHYHVLVLVPDF